MNWPVLIYFVILSVFSFVINTIDFFMFKRFLAKTEKKVRRYSDVKGYGLNDTFMRMVTLFGGSLGTCLAYLVWDPRINSRNVGERLYAFMLLIVQTILFLSLAGPSFLRVDIPYDIGSLFERHPLICWYLVAMTVITFVVFWWDKHLSRGEHWRIPEYALLGLCIAGGTIGGYASMLWFQHKNTKQDFYIGIPMIAIAQGIVIWYLCTVGIIS